jgi:hypothetical protein
MYHLPVGVTFNLSQKIIRAVKLLCAIPDRLPKAGWKSHSDYSTTSNPTVPPNSSIMDKSPGGTVQSPPFTLKFI